MRFMATSSFTRPVSRERLSKKRDMGVSLPSSSVAEQLVSFRLFRTLLFVSASPRQRRVSELKQFQLMSKFLRLVLLSSSPMHCFDTYVEAMPVSARLIVSRRLCPPMALQSCTCSLVFSGTWLRSSVLRLLARPSRRTTPSTVRTPARRQLESSRRCSVCTAGPRASRCRKGTRPASESRELPLRSATSTTAASSSIPAMAISSWSTMSRPFASNFFEWPVTNASGMGTRCKVSHSCKYRFWWPLSSGSLGILSPFVGPPLMSQSVFVKVFEEPCLLAPPCRFGSELA
mmetsp:Transcript_97303/g.275299  ORF Transcript_97303/g.275299 Transcript_97303/m.275299 type:complete len:289 (-) Transcript_97303:1761-2627(-)